MISVPVVPHPFQPLLLSMFWILAVLIGMKGKPVFPLNYILGNISGSDFGCCSVIILNKSVRELTQTFIYYSNMFLSDLALGILR